MCKRLSETIICALVVLASLIAELWEMNQNNANYLSNRSTSVKESEDVESEQNMLEHVKGQNVSLSHDYFYF